MQMMGKVLQLDLMLIYIEYYVKGKKVRTYEEKILTQKTIKFEKLNETRNERKAKWLQLNKTNC